MKKIAELLKFIGTFFLKLAKIVFVEKQEIRTKPWFAINGDKTFRLNYNLTKDSIVFDLGGYEGQWASDIYAKYNCKLFVFEPVKKYAEDIKVRFKMNSNIRVFAVGLADVNSTVKISLLDDSSSVFKQNNNANEEIKLESFIEFVQKNTILEIDLLKINIEGGEFPLLEALVKNPYISNIKNLQIQFHDFVENADNRMKDIQKELSKTHELTYKYEFVWENWKLK